MITLVGKENCSRCEMVKTLLDDRKIQYDYKYLSDLEDSIKKELLTTARNKNLMQLPIIIRDGEVISLSEV